MNLLENLLDMNSDRRLTAEKALSHSYFLGLFDASTDYAAAWHFDESFEQTENTDDLKQLIFRELTEVAINGPSLNIGPKFY